MEQASVERAGARDLAPRLAAIVERPLTADTIETYAESALDDLAELAEHVVDAYGDRPYAAVDGKDLEDLAFEHYGLQGLEDILDHVAGKVTEIQELDEVIAGTQKIERIIMPPAVAEQTEVALERTGEGPKITPRLKTVLFILANDFEVDLHDDGQLTITKGGIDPTMVRQESYRLVQAHGLERSVLVCDEVGNATFVLDTRVLAQLGISADQLIGMRKDELQTLLDSEPGAGQRIEYDQNYVPAVIAALADPSEAAAPNYTMVAGARYLAPKPSDEIVSLGGLAKLLELDRKVVEKAIAELGEELGETTPYNFHNRVVPGYKPEQQALIRQRLQEQGYYDKPPEDYKVKVALAEEFGVAVNVIDRAIRDIGEEELGELRPFKTASRRTPHFSPAQQELIRQRLEATGVFAEDAPEEYETIRSMSRMFGAAQHTVERAVTQLGDDIGKPTIYKFNGHAAEAYGPGQQSMVLSQLHFKGSLGELAPEGFKQASDVARDLGVTPNMVLKTVGELGEDLGEVESYPGRNRRVKDPHYSPGQQDLIRASLIEQGLLGNDPPEGYITLAALAKNIGVAHVTTGKYLEEVRDALGSVKSYKFTTGVYEGYSPHQQEVVAQHVIERMIRSA
jgi:hypothetical protein